MTEPHRQQQQAQLIANRCIPTATILWCIIFGRNIAEVRASSGSLQRYPRRLPCADETQISPVPQAISPRTVIPLCGCSTRRRAVRSRRCTTTTRDFAAASSCSGTISDAANTSIWPIRCRSWWPRCGPRSIPRLPRSPTSGCETPRWRTAAFPPTLRRVPCPSAIAAGQTPTDAAAAAQGPDDFNCLHQDLLWLAGISAAVDRSAECARCPISPGGEFVLVEQRPRLRSRAHRSCRCCQGDAVILSRCTHRPVQGARGPLSCHHAPRRQPRHRRRATDLSASSSTTPPELPVIAGAIPVIARSEATRQSPSRVATMRGAAPAISPRIVAVCRYSWPVQARP